MSDLSGNKNFDAATAWAHGPERDISTALVEATLAVAYEQRTANLIAFLDGAHEPLPPGDGPLELYAEIVKRLGLKAE